MGTPLFMAPEQATDPRTIDIRADIYSLGCTLYFLLSGRTPFTGTTPMQVLLAHQLEQPTPIQTLRPEVPAALAELVGRMLAREPDQRPQTPSAVAQALSPFVAADGIQGVVEEPILRHLLSTGRPRPWQRFSIGAAAVGFVVLAGLVGGGLMLALSRPAKDTGPAVAVLQSPPASTATRAEAEHRAGAE